MILPTLLLSSSTPPQKMVLRISTSPAISKGPSPYRQSMAPLSVPPPFSTTARCSSNQEASNVGSWAITLHGAQIPRTGGVMRLCWRARTGLYVCGSWMRETTRPVRQMARASFPSYLGHERRRRKSRMRYVFVVPMIDVCSFLAFAYTGKLRDP